MVWTQWYQPNREIRKIKAATKHPQKFKVWCKLSKKLPSIGRLEKCHFLMNKILSCPKLSPNTPNATYSGHNKPIFCPYTSTYTETSTINCEGSLDDYSKAVSTIVHSIFTKRKTVCYSSKRFQVVSTDFKIIFLKNHRVFSKKKLFNIFFSLFIPYSQWSFWSDRLRYTI